MPKKYQPELVTAWKKRDSDGPESPRQVASRLLRQIFGGPVGESRMNAAPMSFWDVFLGRGSPSMDDENNPYIRGSRFAPRPYYEDPNMPGGWSAAFNAVRQDYPSAFENLSTTTLSPKDLARLRNPPDGTYYSTGGMVINPNIGRKESTILHELAHHMGLPNYAGESELNAYNVEQASDILRSDIDLDKESKRKKRMELATSLANRRSR